jgi:hypothetical protein
MRISITLSLLLVAILLLGASSSLRDPHLSPSRKSPPLPSAPRISEIAARAAVWVEARKLKCPIEEYREASVEYIAKENLWVFVFEYKGEFMAFFLDGNTGSIRTVGPQ